MLGQNDTQYDKYKTPFVLLKVGDATGQDMVPLPPTLARLLEKVEITSILEGCYHNYQVSLTFREGSREPFKPIQSESTTSLYADTDVTNHIGMLTDLKFVKIGQATGLSSFLPGNIGLPGNLPVSIPTTVSSPGAVGAFAGISGAGSVAPEDITITGVPKSSAPIKYVFEERNQIQITWGYRENPTETRTIRAYIQIVQSFFPENEQPSLVITCFGPSAMFDQVAPAKGVMFSTQNAAGFDPEAGPLFTFEDKPIKDMFQQIESATGIVAIVSDNLINPKLDKYHAKTWPVGKSFNQFLKGLAKDSNAYYIAFIDPSTGKNKIAFLSRSDFEKTPIIKNASLFTYRGHGSILKGVNIKADFSGVTGNMQTGVDADGNIVKKGTVDTQLALPLFQGESSIDTDPTAHNSPPGIQALNADVANNSAGVLGTAEVSPEADEPQGMQEKSYSKEACQRKQIFLDFSSLGHVHLRPGVVFFGGIGSRYSGHYNIISVTHTIDNNGYNCRGNATSWAMKDASGVAPSNAPAGDGVDPQTEIQLFESQPQQSLSYVLDPSAAPSNPFSGVGPLDSFASGNAADEYNQTILA